jgi:hypothetical protein
MKKSLNLLVLLAFLSTSLPMNVAFAAAEENDAEESIEIEVPAEAVEMSEKLVEENKDANANAGDEKSGPSCIKSGVAYSPRMTKAQRKELFVRGQITDCDGNIWNIKVIPGSDKSKQMTIKSWRFAGKEAKQIIKIETYTKAGRDGKAAAKASFNFAKSSSKLLKKGIWDYMIVEGVYKDLIVRNAKVWKQAGVTVAGLHGSFGWLFGAIYAGVLKPVTLTGVNIARAAFHITEGAVVLVGGIAGTAGGLIATVSSPVIVPVVEVLVHPLLAVGSILTTGTIIPGAVYVWNGTAWASTQLSHVPDSETVIGGVRFVRLENPKQAEKPKLEVSANELNTIAEAGVKTATERTQEKELQVKQAELRKQIDELQRQASELANQEYKLRQALEADASVAAVSSLVYKVYSSKVIVSEEVKAAASDDKKVEELALNAASKLGVVLSDSELAAAVKQIKANLANIVPKN